MIVTAPEIIRAMECGSKPWIDIAREFAPQSYFNFRATGCASPRVAGVFLARARVYHPHITGVRLANGVTIVVPEALQVLQEANADLMRQLREARAELAELRQLTFAELKAKGRLALSTHEPN